MNSIKLQISLRSLKSKFTVTFNLFFHILICHLYRLLVYRYTLCQNQGETPQRHLKPDLWVIHALYANYNSNKLLFIVNENSMEDTHMICYFVDQWQWFVLEVWSLRPVKWYWSSSLQKKERRYVRRNIYTHICFSQLSVRGV